MNFKQNIDLKKLLTPKQFVAYLDKYIVGQKAAKKVVAIALRNRWRQNALSENYRKEIIPKNILMIGPTGVGKTEISRRIANLLDAPFIKIEATKFTEVGYIGKDVDSIIRDLVIQTARNLKDAYLDKFKKVAYEEAVLIIAKALYYKHNTNVESGKIDFENSKDVIIDRIKNGELDEELVEIDINNPRFNLEINMPPGMEEISNNLFKALSNLQDRNNNTKKRTLKVKEALPIIEENVMTSKIDENTINKEALESVENKGIVFIDEIDKIIASQYDYKSQTGVSREGVQRDLLPLIEGCTVNTNYGNVKTDNILFIAAGSFYNSKPQDLLPELQGRLPVRVNLDALEINDYINILTEPKFSLLEQHKMMLRTENVELEFTEDFILGVAKLAYNLNNNKENLGARRLFGILESVIEDISYESDGSEFKKYVLDKEYLHKYFNDVLELDEKEFKNYVL